MNTFILTSGLKGSAAHILKRLSGSEKVNISFVVYSEGQKSKQKTFSKRLKKIRKIGLFGAAIGIYLRKFYKQALLDHLQVQSIDLRCKELNIPFYVVPRINSEELMSLIEKSNVDLGVSLGNGYIPSKVFKKPRLGMINVHHEQLPEYQNAQSVIWQIYNGSDVSAYTIHKIEKKIDKGEILYMHKVPLEIKDTIGETIARSYAKLIDASGLGLVKVLADFDKYHSQATVQKVGKVYTTPSFRQFRKIQKEFRKLKARKI